MFDNVRIEYVSQLKSTNNTLWFKYLLVQIRSNLASLEKPKQEQPGLV